MRGREAFQEVDFETMFAPLAKWVCEVDSAARIPELLGRAYATALSGRPGPVVLSLPEDMLVEEAEVDDAPPAHEIRAHPCPEDLERTRELLAGAERPFVLVGGQPWSAAAAADLQAFCEAAALPVGTSFRCQDYVDNGSSSYVGHVGIGPDPRLAARVREADVLLVVGARLGEMTTAGYTLVEPPVPRQTLIHVHAGAEEVGRVYRPELGVVAAGPEFAAALRTLELDGARWRARTEQARAEYVDNLRHTPMPGPVDLGEVMAVLRDRLPDDAILTNGAGNYSVWAHRFYEFHRYRTCLAPTSGAMGYGVPAAVAAKAVASGADGRVPVRRRRLPDVRPGAGDGRAVRASVRRARRRQRHAGDDPHAPGARSTRAGSAVPTSSIPTSPRYARVVRGARRAGRAHGGLRRGLRAGARRRPAGAADPDGRSRGDHAARDADRAARSGAGGVMSGREEIRVDGQAAPISHYTDAVRAGDLLFVSGVVAVDGEGRLVGGDDVVEQARQVFRNIGEVLAAAGAASLTWSR